ncbi:MAG: hypothetical protein M3Y59_17405 [Myxococcota bacterium]|nr:hypothetical protein [Myxococcota bacterium]
MRTNLLTFVLGAALVGCGPSSVLNEWDRAEINDSESLKEWSQGSAPQVYLGAGLLTSAIITAAEQQSEAGCPVKKVDGETTTYTGDCTDSDGNAWFGKATLKGATSEQDGTANFRFEDFGVTGPQDCDSGATANQRLAIAGTSVATAPEAGTLRFTYDLRIDSIAVDATACALERDTLAYSYTGQSVESGSRRTWNGSGRVGTQTQGTVEVSTQDEVMDNSVCSSEAVSGTTTLKGKDTTAVITYDGATDCSDLSTVTWTLDGVAMGTVNGVTCTSAAGAPVWFALLGLLGLGLKRRRG